MFSKVNVKQKNNFLEQTKAQREERAYERQKEVASLKIQVPVQKVQQCNKGAQWLSGRVLDLRPRGRGFEPNRRHCVVVLEQDTFILA